MAKISVFGVDLGKNVYSVVGLEASGAVVMRRRVRRETLIALAEKLPACVVGLDPSGSVVMRRKMKRETLVGLAGKLPSVRCRNGGVLRRPSSGPHLC